MKIVIATDNRFWRKQLGSHQRIYSLITYLEKHFEVIVFFSGKPTENDIKESKKVNIKIIFSSQSDKKIKKIKDIYSGLFNISMLLSNKLISKLKILSSSKRKEFVPTLFHYFNLTEIQKFRYCIDEYKPDVILFEYTRMTYLRHSILNKNIITTVDTHDVGYIRFEQFANNEANSGLNISKKTELKILNHFDYILAIQLEDKINYQNIGIKNVIYTPHAVPFDKILTPYCDRVTLGFIGSAMQSNIDGIKWFLTSILPKINQNIELVIAGSVCKDIITSDNRVVLLGRVENLHDYYRKIHLSINPVQYGSGLKIKSVESICFGKPIITTSIGVEGMPSNKTEPFIICNNIAEWLNCINTLSSVKELNILTNNCELYAQENYSTKSAYSDFVSKLKTKEV